MTEFKETDLYEPIRAFLEEEGYQVQAEVKHCDIAEKGLWAEASLSGLGEAKPDG